MDLSSRLASKKTKEKTSRLITKPKQAKRTFKPKSKKVDSGNEVDDDLSFGTPSPKPQRSVRTKPATTIVISSDEDEEESESDSLQIDESDSEDDFMPDPKRHKKASINNLKPIRAKKVLSKPKIAISKSFVAKVLKNTQDGDSNDEMIESVQRARKGAKTNESRRKVSSDEDDDTYEPFKETMSSKSTSKNMKIAGQKRSSDTQTKARAKKQALDIADEEDSEDEVLRMAKPKV